MKTRNMAISTGLTLCIALLCFVARSRPAHSSQELSQAELDQKLQANLLARVEILYTREWNGPTNKVRGAFYETDVAGHVKLDHGKPTELPFKASVRITSE